MRNTLTFLTALSLLVAAGPLLAQAPSFEVVVNSSNPVSSLSKAQASQFFLKKATSWDGGGKVAPVDQAESRPVRTRFSQAVHGKKVAAIRSYWQKMTFSGRATPPPELNSDSEVLNYVRKNSAAIGYVSSGTSLGDGVKAIRITK